MSELSTIKSQCWLDQMHETGHFLRIPAGDAAVFSRRSPDKSSPNEDGALLIDIDSQRAVLAVADGCGGLNAGDQAARITVETFTADVKRSLERGGGTRAAILDGIEKANSKVLGSATGGAATLAVAEIRDGKIRPYHIGDSQIMLVGNHGKIKLQTGAHSPVGYAMAAGLLSEEEAIHHEDRHIVSNVVGATDCHIEIGSHRKLSLRDTLLIASDGIFDNLQTEEISELIRKGPLETAAENLIQATAKRMALVDPAHPSKPDDATFILFRLAKR